MDSTLSEIRPRIFQIWSSTLCRNSQGRCGNHCKKQEEPVKTLLVPGRGSNPRPPGHQNIIARRSNHSAKRSRPYPCSRSLYTAELMQEFWELEPEFCEILQNSGSSPQNSAD
ncbi:hypothetical protein Bbelb_308970 [Branchiostoma belcheri]|nr:hypothetical protein Bbelb_308970 [Branchiostoma belcheri]